MTPSCRVATVKNSPSKSWLRDALVGGSVLYAPLAPCSVRIDDVAAAYIMAACTPLPLC